MSQTRNCLRCNKEFERLRQNWRKKYCSRSCGCKRSNYDTYAVLEDAKVLSINDLLTKHPISKRALYTLLCANKISIRDRFLNITLDDQQRNLIIGSLLGDAHAAKAKSGKWRIAFVHGPKQYDYLNWKHNILKNITNTKPVTKKTPNAYGKQSRSFRTRLNDNAGIIASKLYKFGVKNVTKDYLDMLNSQSLAIWILDDGSLSKNGGSLCTHSFSIQESRLIAAWFSDRYKLPEPKLVFDKRCEKWSIRFSSAMARSIADECYNFIITIPGMSYKVNWYATIDRKKDDLHRRNTI
jgi:hypothetical protein